MAPGRAESDFGLQGWIGTLGLKEIFLIFSIYLHCLAPTSSTLSALLISLSSLVPKGVLSFPVVCSFVGYNWLADRHLFTLQAW